MIIQSQLRQLIKHFNRYIGKNVYRGEIICIGINKKLTIDTYRRMLEHAGYIKTVRRGVYLTLKKIPLDLTVSKLRKLAYEI